MKTSKEKVEKYIEMARSIALNTVDLNSSDIVEIAKMIQKEELENKPNPLVVYKPEHGNLGTNKTSPFGEHICESGGSTYGRNRWENHRQHLRKPRIIKY